MNSSIVKRFKNLSVHTKIFIGWGFAVTAGLYGFILSKRNITSKRYESMKARERMHRDLSELGPTEHTSKSLWW